MNDESVKVEGDIEELRRRLKEARGKNEAFEVQSRAREEKRDLERKIRYEENKNRDLPYIQAAEEEHGHIRYVNTHDGAVVVKPPHHLAYNQFIRRLSNEKKPVDNNDYWRLVKPCIVYPDVVKVEEMTEKFAGLTVRLGNKVVELGRGDADELEGK
jgi:hypothetical protein